VVRHNGLHSHDDYIFINLSLYIVLDDYNVFREVIFIGKD
jgi:hypothetical protein